MPYVIVLRNRETDQEAYFEDDNGRAIQFASTKGAERVASRVRKKLKEQGYGNMSVGVRRVSCGSQEVPMREIYTPQNRH
jgi:hypothetical protein